MSVSLADYIAVVDDVIEPGMPKLHRGVYTEHILTHAARYLNAGAWFHLKRHIKEVNG